MNPKVFALAIGIGAYPKLPALTSPPNDARDFASVLHSGLAPSEIKLLTNSDATKTSIMNTLAWLAASAGAADTTVLFFSGHGARRSSSVKDAFLCPVNADPKDVDQTCLSSAEMSAAMWAIKSRHLAVFLDTCYSGGVGDFFSDSSVLSAIGRGDAGSMRAGNGRVLLAASHPAAPGLESATMRNGVFTGYLLQALRGDVAQPDGKIWSTDAVSFVAHKMRRHHGQSVYQKIVGENFVIITHSRSSTSPVAIIRHSNVDARVLRLTMRSLYDRCDLSRLCRDLGLNFEDLPGRTIESQTLQLIDFCDRHGLRERLLEFMRADHPQIFVLSTGGDRF